jgi:hypothetical protein
MEPVLYTLLLSFRPRTRSRVCSETFPAWASGLFRAESAMASSSGVVARPLSLCVMASWRLLRCSAVDRYVIMTCSTESVPYAGCRPLLRQKGHLVLSLGPPSERVTSRSLGSSLARSALKFRVPDMCRMYVRCVASELAPQGGLREAVDSSIQRSARSWMRLTCFVRVYRGIYSLFECGHVVRGRLLLP